MDPGRGPVVDHSFHFTSQLGRLLLAGITVVVAAVGCAKLAVSLGADETAAGAVFVLSVVGQIVYLVPLDRRVHAQQPPIQGHLHPEPTAGLDGSRLDRCLGLGVQGALDASGTMPYLGWIELTGRKAELTAILVKLADVEDNKDPERFTLLREETRAWLLRKYEPAKEVLRGGKAEGMAGMNLKTLRRTNTGPTYSSYDGVLRESCGPDLTPASVDLSVRFRSGRGTAEAVICIRPQDFERIAQAMMNVDPAAAIKAFGAAMVAGNQSAPHPLLRE